MKTIGLLGGMSWQSSIEYERLINTEVRRRLGGAHSADLLIRSYDFATIQDLQRRGAWEEAGRLLASDAQRLEDAGADLIVLCTNTMHRVAEAIEEAVTVPFLHLADTTANAVLAAGVQRVALLGTRYTMEQDFYRDRLAGRGLAVLVPGAADRTTVHNVIFDELVNGVINPESRRRYLEIIERLTALGAEGVVGGCTEIELLITQEDLALPFFPTTTLHALATVDAMLG